MAAKLNRFADAYLVERAREGDRMALRVLCLRHFDDAYRYAWIRGGADRAEAVVPEAFRIVVDELQREELLEPFGVRLYGALSELIGTDHGAPAPARNGNGTRHGNATYNGNGRGLEGLSDPALAALIAGLEPDQQEALLLAHILHLKPNEVATAMRTTQEAVGHLESRAIATLAGQLGG